MSNNRDNPNLEALEQSVEALQTTFAELGKLLAQAAEELLGAGLLPDAGLLARLGESARDFDDLQSRLRAAATILRVELEPPAHPLSSLDDVQAAITLLVRRRDFVAARETLRATLADYLERARSVRTMDGLEFGPLIVFHEQVEHLADSSEGLPDAELKEVTRQVVTGEHAVGALLRLVMEPGLDDESASALVERVAGAFRMSLAMAAVRGKLCVATAAGPTDVQAAPAAIPLETPTLRPARAEEPLGAKRSESDLAQATPAEAPSLDQTDVAVKSPEPQPGTHVEGVTQLQQGVVQESLPVEAAIMASIEAEVRPPDHVPTNEATPAAQPEDQVPTPDVPSEELIEQPTTSAAAEETVETPILTEDVSQATTVSDAVWPLEVASALTAAFALAVAAEEPAPQGVEGLPVGGPSVQVPPSPLKQKPYPPALSTATSIARRWIECTPETQGDVPRELLWALIRENDLCLAYWLARYYEVRPASGTATLPVPGWLIEVLALGRAIRSDMGPLAARIAEVLGKPTTESETAEDHEDTLWRESLVLASAMRPVLIAPHTGVLALLDQSVSLPPHLTAIRQAIVTFAERGGRLAPELMLGYQDQAAWQNELDELLEEVKRWLAKAPHVKIIYEAATQVWRDWLRDGGLVKKMLLPVQRNDVTHIEQVRQQVQRLRSDVEVKREIQRTDQRLRPIGGSVIKARAVDGLLGHMHDALDLATRWIAKHDEAAVRRDQWRIESLADLHREFKEHYDDTRDELTQLAALHGEEWPALAGIAACQNSLEDLYSVLYGAGLGHGHESEPSSLLNAELLKLPDVTLHPNWEPAGEMLPSIGRQIVYFLANDQRDWETAFQAHTERRNHQATAWIIEEIRRTGASELAEALRHRRSAALDECRAALRRDVQQTHTIIENAMLNDILTDQDRASLIAEVESTSPEELLNFSKPHEALADVRDKVKRKQDERIEGVRRKIAQTDLEAEARDRITAALERGEIGTADEYLSQARAGLSLAEWPPHGPDSFGEYFPRALLEIERELGAADSPREIVSRVSARSLRSVDLDWLSRPQLNDAQGTLRSWFDLKRSQLINEEWLRTAQGVLSWLGFGPTSLPTRQPSPVGQTWFRFAATLPPPPGLRVPPGYGSAVNGEYQVLCVWERPDEDRLIETVAQGVSGRATLVFHFGRMNDRARRSLARRIRSTTQSARPFLILDDLLLVHLLGERGSRISAFFSCALPFTVINPYTPSAAGNVPPEMFYGREREAHDLQDQHGPGFIFGGRQLGKSALLKHVQRQFHAPRQGQVALYIDLKAEGLGDNLATNDVWQVLIRHFRTNNLIPPGTPANAGPDTILGHVEDWLNAHRNRRILLLLDEADKFLDRDSNDDFARVSQLKGLMDRSDRRFKLVFAGLHNVQRFQQHPNQPLAHLGTPISVGPLAPRDAEALITEPLRALGYRFENRDLVVRILSHTNYYPSLIQLFCDEMLRHLQSAPFDAKTTPPFTITEKHINDAYRSQNLRDRIRERFDWTLNLDPRYRVIAYAIAYESVLDSEASRDGFTTDTVAHEARRWWDDGFKASHSSDDMRGLLDEMVGLGILVKTENERYQLRSPNVLRLLGSLEDIEQRLLEAENLQLPPEFDANSFRRQLAGERNRECSPLTAGQESDLLGLPRQENGVRLVFGSEATGLKDLELALSLADTVGEPGQVVLAPRRELVNKDSLGRWLYPQLDRKAGGRLVILVPITSKLGYHTLAADWIDEATKLLRLRRAPARATRVIFSFDPDALPGWLQRDPAQRVSLEAEGSLVTALRRWDDITLHHWLDAIELAPNSPDQRAQILAATGGWPNLLARFAHLALDDHRPWDEALDELRTDAATPEKRRRFTQQTGLDQWPDAWRMFHILNEMGELSRDELHQFIDDLSDTVLGEAIEFLDRLSLIEMRAGGRLAVEQVAGSIISEGP